MKFHVKVAVLWALCVTLTGFNAQAITITYHSAAPTIESTYVYHLGESTDGSGNVSEGDHNATYIAHDRPCLGQTFTTGPGAYLMNGFWLKNVTYTSTTTWWNTDAADAQLEIRITDPSAEGTAAFELSVEPYTVSGDEEDDSLFPGTGSTQSGTGTGTWVHFELDTPVVLQGDTEYGFDVTSFDTGNNYFFETAGLNGADSYTGGTAYSSGSAGGNSLNMDNIRDGDHVFIVELVPVMPDNGDLTGNGKVDFKDLAVLGNGWKSIYDVVDLWTIVTNWLLIVPPVFNSDPIIESDAIGDIPYNGTLSDDVEYYDVSQLTFSKEGGPEWLNVDPNGALSGTPSSSDEGINNFTVQVDDGLNAPDQATLQITVDILPLYSHSINPVYINDFAVQGFWRTQFKRQITQWLIHCIDTLDTVQPYGIPQFIEAKKALDGLPHASKTGYVFSDAFTHNTVEAMCLALSIDADGDQDINDAQNYIQTKLNEWIPIILDVQQPDGYIDTLVLETIDNGYVRYSNRGNHECYVQAYFIESGVAHYQVTEGQDLRLYNAAKKCGDHFYDTFLVPQRVYSNGHEVIEMALNRLGRLVNEVEGQGLGNKYIDTSKWLMDCRGGGSEYDQNHLPVIQQTNAVGHAVRACYLYSGMTDIALLQQDDDYLNAVDYIWDSAVNRKMYLTGGVGATSSGEAFAGDYVLPNDTGYCETCASCGLIFWNNRMNWHYHDAKYADVVERTIYNNVLSSVDLAGQNYYYQQPLDQSNARYSWHSCPCCVGNIPRTLLALKDKTYLINEDTNSLYVNYFIAGSGTIDNFDGMQIEVEQVTDYPYSGIVDIIVSPEVSSNFSIEIRIPDRTESTLYTATPEIDGYNSIEVNGSPITPAIVDGYVTITRTWNSGDTITLDLPMDIQMIKSDPQVSANLGQVALQYGPMVYNLESVDHNVPTLDSIYIEPNAVLTTAWDTGLLGEGILTMQGTVKMKTSGGYENIDVLSIPHYTRLNRGGRTIVWVADNNDTAYVPPEPPPPGDELIWPEGGPPGGGPYTLSGVDEYITLPEGIMENCSDFTIAAWVWIDTRDAWERIFDFGTGTNTNMFLTVQSSADTLRYAITTGGGGGEQQINGPAPLPTGSWQHVAVTLSGTTGRLYLNGNEIASSSISIAPYLLGTTNQNYIGKSQYSDPYLDGQVDDFRIYNYALSENDIANLAASPP